MDCLFCKIARGDIPSECVYEDDATYAFLDIAPNTKGHTLVIPKTHARNIYEMDADSLCAVMRTVQKCATHIKAALAADGINIAMNNDAGAGQEVDHAHIHIIPRYEGDGLQHWPKIAYADGEATEIAIRIRDAMK